MTTEATVASKVLWEFTDPDMGYTYGEPRDGARPRKYGWVVIVRLGLQQRRRPGLPLLRQPAHRRAAGEDRHRRRQHRRRAGLAQVQRLHARPHRRHRRRRLRRRPAGQPLAAGPDAGAAAPMPAPAKLADADRRDRRRAAGDLAAADRGPAEDQPPLRASSAAAGCWTTRDIGSSQPQTLLRHHRRHRRALHQRPTCRPA